jgi:hypothetical protein
MEPKEIVKQLEVLNISIAELVKTQKKPTNRVASAIAALAGFATIFTLVQAIDTIMKWFKGA